MQREEIRARTMRASVQPFAHLAVRVEIRTAAAIRPAHVRDADEVRRRQPVLRADLARQQSRVAAESHRADAALIRFVDNARFERGELRVVIRVVELAQELLLREVVAGGAVAADADAEDSGAAALALGLEDAV